jgi:anti-anti-sigma regulatory factor
VPHSENVETSETRTIAGAFVIEFVGRRSYRLLGDLSWPNVELFNEILRPALAADGDLVLQLDELESLDSSGSRAIQEAAAFLAGRGTVRVERPTERVALVLDLMGARDDGIVVVVPEVDDGIVVVIPEAGDAAG